MKKLVKIGIATILFGTVIGTAIIINNNVYAAEEVNNNLNVVLNKDYLGYEIINGKYGSRKFDMYYSDGYFANSPNEYEPHIATLAAQLADVSETYIDNGNYEHGDKSVREALGTLGFNDIYTSDTYNKKPTTESIACAIAEKRLAQGFNMNYDYLIDITIRSANYEAEWASNVVLGEKGEAEGFKKAAEDVVNIYLDQFLDARPRIKNELENGNVAFFLNGYSRGGATANLAAKRLIDEYQTKGNGIYAYCIECPQGGVKEEINPKLDYRGIHNIINPNDIVCYVAPREWGFIRYGVDHYVYGDERFNENGEFFEVPCDNHYDVRDYYDKKKEVTDELKKMLKTDDVNKYIPYDVTWKKLDLRHFKVLDDKSHEFTCNFIGTFMNKLIYKNGRMAIDRATYHKKLEPALKNIMTFLHKDTDIKNRENITEYKELFNVFVGALVEFVNDVKVSATDTTNPLVIAWRFISGGDNLVYKLDITPAVRERVAALVKHTVASQPKICKILEESYPTKKTGALNDIYTVVYEIFAGSNNLDDFITLGMNIDGFGTNHDIYQAIAWLRLNDNYFVEHGAEGGW